MSNNNPIPDFNALFNTIKRKIVVTAEIEGVRFIQGNFDKQGFTDEAFEAWKPRNPDFDAGRAILRDTTNLRGNIKSRGDIDAMQVEFSTDVVYAEIHNEGGEITVTAAMKSFFWAKFYEADGKDVKEEDMNPKQLFFKRMALMTAGNKIKIPKRQYMGDSQEFNNELDKEIAAIIAAEFQSLFT